jgi:hypothetical protein
MTSCDAVRFRDGLLAMRTLRAPPTSSKFGKQLSSPLWNPRVNSIAISNVILVYGRFSCVFAIWISHDVKIKLTAILQRGELKPK